MITLDALKLLTPDDMRRAAKAVETTLGLGDDDEELVEAIALVLGFATCEMRGFVLPSPEPAVQDGMDLWFEHNAP